MYALLEVKRSEAEYLLEQNKPESKMNSREHNQRYYVNKIDNIAFARFIYPENMDFIINELHEYFYN